MTFPRISRLARLSRLRLAILGASSVASLAFACGGISDPTRGSENVATVSGALTGTSLPANARVALVWRRPGSGSIASSVEVGSDVPVIAGKFSMNVGAPSAAYFQNIDGAAFDNTASSGAIPPGVGTSVPTPPPTAPTSGGSSTSGGGARMAMGTQLTPRDIVGGQITEPLSAAVAGFVVYADTNGNGKLDLAGEYAASTDQILGGNSELILTYLQGGGALDYEKLRDTSGILPVAGFDLAWSQGRRWLPLNVVELKLTGASAQLPSTVCAAGYSSGSSSGTPGTFSDPPADKGGTSAGVVPSGGSSGTGGPSGGGTGSSSGSTGTAYPSPTDPGLRCAPDGRSFSYTSSTPDCPPPPPMPVGLCAGNSYALPIACASGGGGGYGSSLLPGDPVPSGWPCPVAVDADAGPFDAGAGG